METIVNDVIIRHNFVTKILFTNGEDTLSKDLKVKIMAMRIEYGKIHKSFDADVQEFTESILDDKFKELRDKNRTEEENTLFNNMINDYNNQANAYIMNRSQDKVEINNTNFTNDELNEIILVNMENDVEINGNKIPAPDFLEALNDIFCK